MSAPFTNEYNVRTVASNQSKACTICYKPSDNVMITNNNVDFFYICLSHLKDESFATTILNDEYNQLVNKKNATELLLKELYTKKETHKPSMFNKIPGVGDKEKLQQQDEKYKELKDEIIKNETDVKDLDQQITNFKFKKYNLNNDVYKIRLRNYMNKKLNEMRMKQINEPGFFPSTNGLKDL